jgi:hypothetical protein
VTCNRLKDIISERRTNSNASPDCEPVARKLDCRVALRACASYGAERSSQ